ncbi:MAG: glycosyltransferase [Cyanobacteria bacterium P01_F01_bin.143]
MLATREVTSKENILRPRIVIVIPIFKHSVLVAEAITCALGQDTELPFKIILVNDGCKFQETDRVCRDFAIARPDLVIYLYCPNGGLSAARNTGIDFALQTWDSVAAIYLLDADNRISPHTIERSFNVLRHNPQVGWVYPAIDMFGKEKGGDFDYRGEYSKLRHLKFNTCEAGSMIRREVFEAGCRYDESMTLGFEDWEFWWQAIEAGYEGQHLPESGFQYRKRFESMLSDSIRDAQTIEHYMRRKHLNLFVHRRLLAWEHQEAPRYAIFNHDREQVILTSDPQVIGRSLSLETWQDEYTRGRLMPVRYHRSHFLVFASDQILTILQEQGLSNWVFWQLENLLNCSDFASLTLEINSESTSIVTRKESQPSVSILSKRSHLIMTTVEGMDRSLFNDQDNLILNLVSFDPLPKAMVLEVSLPESVMPQMHSGEALSKLIAIFRSLRGNLLPETTDNSLNWHDDYLPDRSRMFKDLRSALDCATVYPKLTNKGEKQIGFILSIVEFGGVENVALNIAQAFKEAGWNVHLFVFSSRMQQLPAWAQIFTTVNFYHEISMNPWQGMKYMGSKSDSWAVEQEKLTAKGLLSWLDVAVNFHSATVNSVMALLKRSGVITLASLHVNELSFWHRPFGYPYLTLGYEHSYDYLIPCSQNMANWCHSMGVPEDKIITVPNACGYPLAETKVAEIITRRRERGFTGKLRILFIGRFVRQKGLERLLELVGQSEKLQLPIHWRLIGKNICQAENPNDPLQAIANLIEPPVFSPEDLTQLYEWADILVLPSYWEGLPLTILEAMRLGVVVLCSKVGAIDEVVVDQINGLTIGNNPGVSFSELAIAQLQRIIENPQELERLSQAAAFSVAKRSWRDASSHLIAKLDELMTKKKLCK